MELSEPTNQSNECDRRDNQNWKKKVKNPNYHRDYYQKNKAHVGKYTVKKYAKKKYNLDDDDVLIYGEEYIKEYGRFMELKNKLNHAFPDNPLFI